MSKLVVIFACVTLLQIATALKCYQCDKDTCTKEKSTWKEQSCGNAIPPMEAACLTHTYKDADQKEYTVRNCVQINPKEDYKCNSNLGDKLTCNTCTTDLCNTNSASSIGLSFVAVSGVVLALFAQKFSL